MRLDDFDYALPPELVAQHPAPRRAGSRLLYLDAPSGRLQDETFDAFARHVEEGDVVVANDTRVLKARFIGRRESGGRVELLVERIVGRQEALAFVRASHAPRPGTRISIAAGIDVVVLGRDEGLFRIRFDGADATEAIELAGALPLPPYIRHAPDAEDADRYQTIFAARPGAVAAPTAGLHFDAAMLASLRDRGARIATLTLHIGAGTFQPVRGSDIEAHRMHLERFEVPAETARVIATARIRGRRVLAVGTSTLRALETAAIENEGWPGSESVRGETGLFVRPGFRFRVVDRLLTNFHLPKSTLLMLVAAFAGLENIRHAYAHAVAARYRFFSYGDAMLIERAP